MANDNIYIYNHETGEEITREMTAEEKAERDAEIAAAAEYAASIQAEIDAKETKKLEILDKLGLTSDEAKALLG